MYSSYCGGVGARRGLRMWTLVFYTMIVGTSVGAGAHSNTMMLKFDTETQCKAAFERLAVTSAIFDNTNKQVGVHRVSGQCVEGAK
jgi:hypothetical protein